MDRHAYVLALAALILVGGTLGDRFGRRRLMLVGLVIFTALQRPARSRRTIPS